MNKSSRGGKRLIFRSNNLADALTSAFNKLNGDIILKKLFKNFINLSTMFFGTINLFQPTLNSLVIMIRHIMMLKINIVPNTLSLFI